MFFQSLNSEMLDMALQFMNIYNGYLEMKVAELSDQNSQSSDSLEVLNIPEQDGDKGAYSHGDGRKKA